MPPNTVKVTRPGKWGNPFKVGSSTSDLPFMVVSRMKGELEETVSQSRAVEAFEIWTSSCYDGKRLAEFARIALSGRNLACFCKLGAPCHADVLLALANRGEAK